MDILTESSFNKAFKLIINGFEGKYSCDKDDTGGETYKGISRNNNPNFEGWEIIDKDKGEKDYPAILEDNEILQELVSRFYKKYYWDTFQGDELEEDTSIEMFDQSVNMGTKRAIEHLQRSLNILNECQKLYSDINVDGIMGEQTLGTYKCFCKRKKEIELVIMMNIYQGKFYIEMMEKKNNFEKFYGLFKRVTIN